MVPVPSLVVVTARSGGMVLFASSAVVAGLASIVTFVSFNYASLSLFPMIYLIAICSIGCKGSCLMPDECYCFPGYSGPFCNETNPLSADYAGLGKCKYKDVNTSCLTGLNNT